MILDDEKLVHPEETLPDIDTSTRANPTPHSWYLADCVKLDLAQTVQRTLFQEHFAACKQYSKLISSPWQLHMSSVAFQHRQNRPQKPEEREGGKKTRE